MAISKFDSYYLKLKEEAEVIKENEGYNNISLAFAHWFLSIQYGLNDQEIAESVIDGEGDYGIDAFIHNENNKELEIFQFKFPSKTETIKKEIPQSDIYKVINGFNYLLDTAEELQLNKASENFINLKDNLRNSEIYKFKINFVSFNQGIVDNEEILINFINKIQRETGIDISYDTYDVHKISNIYEKMQRKNSVSINLTYTTLQQAYTVKDIESYVGLINSNDLIESIKEKIGVIFDENIRLAEKKSKVNDNIKRTASNDSSEMFYFYNNGITFICDNIENSPNSRSAKLEGASIVNGCQTVTSLYDIYNEGKLKKDTDLLVRITKISDYEQRSKITQFLNSQNPIKDSYFIANHSIVRDLQSKLKEKGYFLERQINEVAYKDLFTNSSVKKGKRIIKLEDVIQYYSAYYLDKFVTASKRSKATLFSSDNVEEILSEITEEKVIYSYNLYRDISAVITTYRRYRRNKDNEDFINIMGIERANLEKEENQYLFINTADILILNTCRHLRERGIETNNNEEMIVKAIKLIKKTIDEDPELSEMIPASLTKNQKIYNKIKKAKLT
ncbi:AIPR family protein [Staphylococcus pseudintermedius]|uniref:AIPR family protein n=2 Tax=Staphylococcus pseudintermedius TaxID=283734 RepID=A0A7T7NY10_STAPS|nr:AIPR family protein [Staphylococcus pseudintermedius]QQM98153.1 AIPR family protein [Staphylococcus pseudintermedius]